MNIRYRVELSQTERAELSALVRGGKHAARKVKRAQILLAADAGTSDDDIAAGIACQRLNGLSDQTPLCAWQSGGGTLRRATSLAQAASSRANRRPCWTCYPTAHRCERSLRGHRTQDRLLI